MQNDNFHYHFLNLRDSMEIYTRRTYKQIFEEIFRDALKERHGKFLADDEVRECKAKDLIIELLLKTGKISVPYIMRKLKYTPEEVRAKIIEATKHECCEWDGMEIHFFSPEFLSCKCFTPSATEQLLSDVENISENLNKMHAIYKNGFLK